MILKVHNFNGSDLWICTDSFHRSLDLSCNVLLKLNGAVWIFNGRHFTDSTKGCSLGRHGKNENVIFLLYGKNKCVVGKDSDRTLISSEIISTFSYKCWIVKWIEIKLPQYFLKNIKLDVCFMPASDLLRLSALLGLFIVMFDGGIT